MHKRKIDELRNRIEILDETIERLDKKREHEGLTVIEDHDLVKAIFEEMDLRTRLKHLLRLQARYED